MTRQFKHDDFFVFEPETFRIVSKNKEVKLSHKEATLLVMLCENAMRVVERRTILAEIWGDSDSSDIGLNKSILLLRRKFESIGLDKIIDTIPRVGYILRLNIEVLDGTNLSQQDLIVTTSKNINETEERSEQKIFNGSKFNIKSIALLIFLALSSLLVYLSSNEKLQTKTLKDLMSIKTSDQSQDDRTILHSIDTATPQLYSSFINKVEKKRSFYALFSKSIISYVDINKSKDIIWQKTFFLDHKLGIDSQLNCIANYINNYKPEPVNVDDIPGMVFVRLKFYRVCKATPDYIGEMIIKTTYPVEDEPKNLMFTQDFTFTNANKKVVFHLKRVSRAHTYDEKIKYLSVKSISVDTVEQEMLQLDNDINRVFNQFTQDDIYQIIIDKESKIYASNPFGGILYHVKEFK